MLDALLPNKDGEGYRLDEQGRRLSIIFELDQTRTTFLDMFELVVPMYQAVGIDAQVRTMDRSLWEERVRRGREFDATAHQFGANCGIAAMLDAALLRAVQRTTRSTPRAGSSTTSQPDNRERDRAAGRTSRRSRISTATCWRPPTRPAQKEKMAQMLENAADQFLVWGVSLPPDGYGVVKNNMVNVLKKMPNSFGWPTPGPARPEQFFKALIRTNRPCSPPPAGLPRAGGGGPFPA